MVEAKPLGLEVHAAEPPVDILERLMERDVLDDPFPFYRWVRESMPVHRHRSGSYIMSRHADVQWMFRSPQLRAPERADIARAFPRAQNSQAFAIFANTVAMNNPPAHTRVRRLISRTFTFVMVQNLQARMERITHRLLDAMEEPLRDGDVVDLHENLALPLSREIISELLGVPESDRADLAPLVLRTLLVANPVATDEMLAQADDASATLVEYFDGLIEERRKEPKDDLISTLTVTHDDDDDRLSRDELDSMLWGFWTGGFETTGAAIDNAVIILLRNPDQAHWLRHGAEKAKMFVNETLRYDPPNIVTGIARITSEDVTVGRVTIPAGSDVRGLPSCANRDPAAFAEPDRFDPSRDHSTIATFGHGIHYCLGSHLARAEPGVALPLLHEKFPDLTLAEPPVRRRRLPLRACDRVAVALDQTTKQGGR